MTAVTVNQRDVMRGMTMEIRVTGRHRMRVRIWLAVRLLYLAARVMGTQTSVDVDLRGGP